MKDPGNLIEMREVQCFGRAHGAITAATYIQVEQKPLIRETFKQWIK